MTVVRSASGLWTLEYGGRALTSAEMEREIRLISERLRVINNDTPEMTGMDWASEQGWISPEEWEAASLKAQTGVVLQDAEAEKIGALRKEHPAAMEEFLRGHLERLTRARDELDRLSRAAEDAGLEFGLQFNLALLPDIISCLTAWRDRDTPKHWPAWMWRVAFNVVEESEAFLAQGQSPGHG